MRAPAPQMGHSVTSSVKLATEREMTILFIEKSERVERHFDSEVPRRPIPPPQKR